MFYRKRELRRLWEVEIYDGNPDAKKPKNHIEKVVAWNAVDAIRRCGEMRVASQPKAVCFVTWPEAEGSPIFKIESTAGPTDEEIKPSIGGEDDWKK